MNRLLFISCLAYSLLLAAKPLNSQEYDAFTIKQVESMSESLFDIIGVNFANDNGESNETKLSTREFDGNYWNPKRTFINERTSELFIEPGGSGNKFHAFNWRTNTWRDVTAENTSYFLNPPVIGIDNSTIQIGSDTNDFDIVEDGINIDGSAVITKKTDGTIQIGTDENDIDITSEGIAIDGDPLITKKANGELHIGKNSWITKEENGRQKVWAKDAAGNSIPIDYTNGTKLLINGRDVEQSINNVGALSAALTGLPTVPIDTTLACGLGTGTHGGGFAFSGGCASKVNEKLSINYAASMTMPGQDYGGDFEDQFSARAGFVWKLGKATKPTQISMKETKELKKEISDLKVNNKNIIAQNNALLARLDKLEKIALGGTKSKDLAVYKLK